jgi:hypothetical protein
MRALLLNRFSIAALLLLAVVGGWNLYVAAHAHGIVTGVVVDAAGRPVPGALVRLYERDFINQLERAHTETDAAGAFRFTANASHLVQLEAERDGRHSPRLAVRLWFRAQDVALAAPLVLP